MRALSFNLDCCPRACHQPQQQGIRGCERAPPFLFLTRRTKKRFEKNRSSRSPNRPLRPAQALDRRRDRRRRRRPRPESRLRARDRRARHLRREPHRPRESPHAGRKEAPAGGRPEVPERPGRVRCDRQDGGAQGALDGSGPQRRAQRDHQRRRARELRRDQAADPGGSGCRGWRPRAPGIGARGGVLRRGVRESR